MARFPKYPPLDAYGTRYSKARRHLLMVAFSAPGLQDALRKDAPSCPTKDVGWKSRTSTSAGLPRTMGVVHGCARVSRRDQHAGPQGETVARLEDLQPNTAIRGILGFYGSTPSYKPVLDVHGWGDLQPELNRLSKQGDWATMFGLIDDEVMNTLAVV